ncbi:MAG TPA: zinc ribbon domain-containing protein [Verrucomicrobiae bacterium]|nr:zinc ribbon domain-containing protein [Verrucomicrobiae bacterium]
MPIFEYKCADCGTRFEKLVRNGNAAELACPSCGEKHLQQEFSTFSAHASSGKSAEMPVCPSGRCSNPGMCGMN